MSFLLDIGGIARFIIDAEHKFRAVIDKSYSPKPEIKAIYNTKIHIHTTIVYEQSFLRRPKSFRISSNVFNGRVLHRNGTHYRPRRKCFIFFSFCSHSIVFFYLKISRSDSKLSWKFYDVQLFWLNLSKKTLIPFICQYQFLTIFILWKVMTKE